MPKLVNNNAHGIRARTEDGRPVRMRAGEVRDVSGAEADALSGISDVDTASQEDEDRYNAEVEAGSGVMEGKSGFDNILSDARTAVGMQAIVAPLNQVIGDDAAPVGPPTGTITTKQALAEESPELRAAFAPNERLPSDRDNDNLQDVELAQAELKAMAQEVTEEMQAEGKLSGAGEGEKPVDPEQSRPCKGQQGQASQIAEGGKRGKSSE